jgi:DNA-binding MarR family transcriptional regulator
VEEQLTSAELLAKLIEQLKLVYSKLDLLTQQNAELLKIYEAKNMMPFNPQADVMTLLKLSPSLRKTAMALYRFEKATADDIAKVTGRSRPVESDCANQLVRMGLVNKKREGLDVYFSIEPKLEVEE